MLRDREQYLARQINAGLCLFDHEFYRLYGIDGARARQTLIEQLIESIRRIKYVSVIKQRGVSQRRADPNDGLFDPLKAAIHFRTRGDIDEAFWMVFLFIHFGKHRRSRYQYARRVYGRRGGTEPWSWYHTSRNIDAFRQWLDENRGDIKADTNPGGFGNHRKYQSLDAYSPNGTGATFQSYIEWIGPPRSHLDVVNEVLRCVDHDPRKAFRLLYQSMNNVTGFGRLAKFDYLAMLGKLEFVPIIPDSAYLSNSPGPLAGARFLFGVHESPLTLDAKLVELDGILGLGMQVWEDALCNWQKSPYEFVPFRG